MTDFPLATWSGRDGSRLQIRAIRPGDEPALAALFAGLDPLSRRRRFHAPIDPKAFAALDREAAVDAMTAELRRRVERSLLPGVKADLRSYEHPVMVSGAASFDTLLEMAATIFKSVPGINRCIWNLGPVAPARVRYVWLRVR